MMKAMKTRMTRAVLVSCSLAAGMTVVSGQTQTAPPTPPGQTKPANPKDQAVFRATANYVYSDVKVLNEKGQFVPDLNRNEFKVFEDGVEQAIEFWQLVHGGRTFTTVGAAARPAATEGLILPPTPPPIEESGRFFVIFIDDLHLQTSDSILAKRVLKQMRDIVFHDGDQYTIVGTGFSGLDGYTPMYYYKAKHAQLDEAIDKVMGSGLTPDEIIQSNETADGPSGLRYRVDTAFRTAYDILSQMEQIQNRRKAFIYVSSGYDLDPFKDSRLQHQMDLYNFMNVPDGGASQVSSDPAARPLSATQTPRGAAAPQNPFAQEASLFSEADLMREIGELIRTARRADTVFYTVDPRGLIGASPTGQTELTAAEWSDFATQSVSTLKILAEQTGGIAGVNTNDFGAFFRKVDADFSDYYEIGYYSTNVDPLKRTRKIEVRVSRPGTKVELNRDTYSIKSTGDVKPKPDKIIKK